MSEVEEPFYRDARVVFRQPHEEVLSEEERRDRLFNLMMYTANFVNVLVALALIGSLANVDIYRLIYEYAKMLWMNPEEVLRRIYPIYYFCMLLYIGLLVIDPLLLPHMTEKGLPRIKYVKTMAMLKLITLSVILPFQPPTLMLALMFSSFIPSLYVLSRLTGREKW